MMPTLTHEGIEVNRKQIKRVIESLIENAADACGKKGAITVATAIMPGALKIYIKDDGEGIKPEHKPLIFTPFFTTKPFGDGLGLGLSICYGIIRSFGGTIRAENRPQGGASFIIELRYDGPVETDGENGISTSMLPAARTSPESSIHFEQYHGQS